MHKHWVLDTGESHMWLLMAGLKESKDCNHGDTKKEHLEPDQWKKSQRISSGDRGIPELQQIPVKGEDPDSEKINPCTS